MNYASDETEESIGAVVLARSPFDAAQKIGDLSDWVSDAAAVVNPGAALADAVITSALGSSDTPPTNVPSSAMSGESAPTGVGVSASDAVNAASGDASTNTAAVAEAAVNAAQSAASSNGAPEAPTHSGGNPLANRQQTTPATTSSSSKLPLILASVAVGGLVLAVIVALMKKKRKKNPARTRPTKGAVRKAIAALKRAA